MSWNVHSIGDLFDVARGGSPRPIDDFITDDFDGINWIMIGDASEGSKYIRKTKKKIKRAGLSKSRMVRPGDFLLTNSMSFGRPYITQTEGCIHDGWLVLSPREREKVHPDFVYHLLGSPEIKLEFERLAAGAVVKNLNSQLVRSVKVRIPDDIDEQRRIALILDKADAIRRKRKDALDLTEKLLDSVFIEMFGNPVGNPRRWSEGVIGDCLTGIVGGWSAKGESRPASPSEMGVLKISAVTSGEYIPTENKAVPSVPSSRTLIVPRSGDLLFSRANTRELVAATCIVLEAPENVFLPDKLWRLDVNSDVAEASYLKVVLSHPEYRQLLCSRATGTSGSMLNISKAKLIEHPIPLPPVELQRTYAKLWLSVSAMKEKLRRGAVQTDSFFNSLTQRAFRGEL